MTSRRSVLIALAGAALGLAVPARAGHPPDVVRLGADLEVRRLRPTVWVHVSTDAQGVPANGLIVRTRRGLLLVDTGWTEGQTDRLVAWAERALGAFFAQAVVTHSHGDRSGGLPALVRRNVPFSALDLTVDKLRAAGAPLPRVLLTTAAPLRVDALGFEAFYPGPGHAADNIVVWLPAEKVLFGGCLVKSEAATDLGNVADADLTSWPGAVEAVRDRYPGASIVVPGHGPVGGPAALVHTLELLRQRASPSPVP